MYLGALDRKTFPTRRWETFRRTETLSRLAAISDGLPGISQTLNYMRAFVSEYKTNPAIRELALSLTRRLPQKDYLGEARALHDFVQNSIRYVRDIADTEVLQTPLKTLEYGAGDCDDKSMLLAAMLESIGHETRFHAMGFRRGSISHVTVEDLIGGVWVPLETTEPVALGWLPPNIRESMYR
jgi:transglutaminase-like putative cysteine protease